MKKIFSLLMISLIGSVGALATPVSMQRAGSTALSFAKTQRDAAKNLSVSGVMKVNDGMYLVNLAPRGFVLVSADDCAEPIMGFSMTSNMDADLIPSNMQFMIDQASQAVEVMAKRGTVNPRWSSISTGTVMSRAEGEEVDPLITVKWNQPSPFNKYCPGSGNNKAVVGCVAVAMGQAMSVQRYPDKPQGQVLYSCPGYGELSIDFDKQQPYNWDAILSGANNYDEVARLVYHTGMSVNMGYGADGSGIPSNQVYRISNALKDNFGYNKDVTYHWKKSYSGDWEQMLLNELYAGRAIIYNAIDSKGGYGHSFNIDGFREGLFHVNWGWGGYGNAYFKINALKDAQMGMNYDDGHVAVIGIGAANSVFKSIMISDDYVETGMPVGSPVCLLQVNGEKPDLSKMKIEVTGEWDKTLGDYRESPFKYQDGKLVTTRDVALSEGSIYVRVVVQLKDGSNTKLTQGFVISVEEKKDVSARTSLSYDRQTQMFTVHSRFGAKYTLKDANGQVIITGSLDEDPSFTFNRSTLSSGNNQLEIISGGQSKTVTIKN